MRTRRASSAPRSRAGPAWPGGDQDPPLEEVAAAFCDAVGRDASCVMLEPLSSRRRMAGRIIEYRARVAGSHDRRGPPDHRLIGKVYDDAGAGAWTFRMMRHLWRSGFRADARYSMSRPIAFLPRWRLLLMDRAPGVPLAAMLDDVLELRRAARRVAAWLLRLHHVPLPPFRVLRGPRPERRLGRIIRETALALPALAPRVDRIGARLRSPRRDRRWPPDRRWPSRSPTAAIVHGDPHPRNILVDGDRITVIDFDYAALGDPAWDLAYLRTQVELLAFRRTGEFRDAAGFGRELVAAYRAGVGGAEVERAAFAARLARDRALTLLDSLHYDTVILRDRRIDVAAAIVAEAERSLFGDHHGEGDGRVA